MNLTNFDEIVFKKTKKPLKQRNSLMPTWDNQTFRCCLIGPSGCGKSNLLLNMIINGLVFDDIHLFCLQKHEPYYEFLGNYFEEIETKLNKKLEKKGLPPQKVFNIYDKLDEFPSVLDMPAETKHLIIFDDVLGEKDLSKVVEYFTTGRKRSCGCILLTQSFYSIPKVLRQQCNYYDLFHFPSARETNMIRNDVCPEIDKDKFKKMIKYCKSQPHGFLHIDRKTKNPNRRFMCKYDKYFTIMDDSDDSDSE